jgi:hypothetical protein
VGSACILTSSSAALRCYYAYDGHEVQAGVAPVNFPVYLSVINHYPLKERHVVAVLFAAVVGHQVFAQQPSAAAGPPGPSLSGSGRAAEIISELELATHIHVQS